MPRKRTSEQVHGPAHRRIRERSGYSVGSFAQAVSDECGFKVTSQTISNIEAERRNPSPELLDAMAHVLRCKKAELLRCPNHGPDGDCPHRHVHDDAPARTPYVRTFERTADAA